MSWMSSFLFFLKFATTLVDLLFIVHRLHLTHVQIVSQTTEIEKIDIFNGKFAEKNPLVGAGIWTRDLPTWSISVDAVPSLRLGHLLSPTVGPFQVASALGDLVAVANKLLWWSSKLSQGLYIKKE